LRDSGFRLVSNENLRAKYFPLAVGAQGPITSTKSA